MKAWLALLFVAVLFIVGCGGGSDDPSPATTTEASSGQLTKAELIEQGDAICAKAYAVKETLSAEGTTEEAVRYAKLVGGMVKELLALGVPQETNYDYAEYTNYAHELEEAEAEVERMAKRGNPADLRLAEAGSLSAFSAFQGNAATYGFKACGGS
jgi:hypothetical protein